MSASAASRGRKMSNKLYGKYDWPDTVETYSFVVRSGVDIDTIPVRLYDIPPMHANSRSYVGAGAALRRTDFRSREVAEVPADDDVTGLGYSIAFSPPPRDTSLARIVREGDDLWAYNMGADPGWLNEQNLINVRNALHNGCDIIDAQREDIINSVISRELETGYTVLNISLLRRRMAAARPLTPLGQTIVDMVGERVAQELDSAFLYGDAGSSETLGIFPPAEAMEEREALFGPIMDSLEDGLDEMEKALDDMEGDIENR